MIEELAEVTQTSGDIAEVVTRRHHACGSCSASSGCGTSLIAAWLPQRELRFRLRNDVAARPGDTVVLGLEESMLQRGALLLYAVPLAGLLGGAVIGELASASVGLAAELGAVATGLLGLTTALWLVRRYSTRRLDAGSGGVRIVRIQHNTGAPTASLNPRTPPARTFLGKER